MADDLLGVAHQLMALDDDGTVSDGPDALWEVVDLDLQRLDPGSGGRAWLADTEEPEEEDPKEEKKKKEGKKRGTNGSSGGNDDDDDAPWPPVSEERVVYGTGPTGGGGGGGVPEPPKRLPGATDAPPPVLDDLQDWECFQEEPNRDACNQICKKTPNSCVGGCFMAWDGEECKTAATCITPCDEVPLLGDFPLEEFLQPKLPLLKRWNR